MGELLKQSMEGFKDGSVEQFLNESLEELWKNPGRVSEGIHEKIPKEPLEEIPKESMECCLNETL